MRLDQPDRQLKAAVHQIPKYWEQTFPWKYTKKEFPHTPIS
jgi:hypothetical protein